MSSGIWGKIGIMLQMLGNREVALRAETTGGLVLVVALILDDMDLRLPWM